MNVETTLCAIWESRIFFCFQIKTGTTLEMAQPFVTYPIVVCKYFASRCTGVSIFWSFSGVPLHHSTSLHTQTSKQRLTNVNYVQITFCERWNNVVDHVPMVSRPLPMFVLLYLYDMNQFGSISMHFFEIETIWAIKSPTKNLWHSVELAYEQYTTNQCKILCY